MLSSGSELVTVYQSSHLTSSSQC